MEFRKEFDILEFDFWSGAKWIEDPSFTFDQLNLMSDIICSFFEGSIPSETEINDFVWFQLRDFIKENQVFGDNINNYSQF